MIQTEKDRFTKANNTLASVRVKHGQTWEQWIPLAKDFEKLIGPKEQAVFLGMPIDYIHFGDDKITFIEVKTGNSRLSQRQRQIKHLIQQGKIEWSEMNDALGDNTRISGHPMMKTTVHRNNVL